MGPKAVSLPFLFLAAWVGSRWRDYQLPRVPATIDVESDLSRVESVGAAAVAACDRLAPCPSPPRCPVVLNLTTEFEVAPAATPAGAWVGAAVGAACAAAFVAANAFGLRTSDRKVLAVWDEPGRPGRRRGWRGRPGTGGT